MNVSYRGYDSTGRGVSGTIEAPGPGEARELLRKRGVFATEVGEGAAASTPARAGGASVIKLRLKELALFMREMATLISTGTPVAEALGSLERQAGKGAMRAVVGDLREAVEQGLALSEAMGRHPRCFDGVCRSLVRAGEEGGRVDEMLDRLSKLLRQKQKVRGALVGAMIYPALLISVAMGVLGAMIGFVLPRFKDMFSTLQVPLPATTRILLSAGEFTKQWWWAMLPAAVAAAVALALWIRSRGGRERVQRLSIALPALGRVTRAFAMARVARVLGVLLEGKVPLLDALRLTRESTWNIAYVQRLAAAEDALARGEGLASALVTPEGGVALFSPAMCEAIRNAEKGGRLSPVLLGLADHLDEDNEVAVKALTSVVEPLILIVLGLVVGTVAISLFLPLFDLSSGMGGGA